MAASTSLNPEQRRERARKAAEARKNPDHLIKALAEIEAAKAPGLTEEQKARLAAIFCAPAEGA